ncbi:hypothetical protein [Flavobacterium salmonis]|uniref:Uncharacterized protein n=1 Tax=Flavobacterium salmonis TaxID=2654844 RepID=A0A6V6Z711_9FLAO|nr:hypothetical protein [Flavobacterium salmonis]CAD0007568.1 hypothetical protein FLAT13_03903 [Flavobacterium salmonis]
MAVTEKNILKNWFLNGLKPPQEQFWAWQESYFHKYDVIPPTAIEGLSELLNSKADKEAFDSHLQNFNTHLEDFNAHVEDLNAHYELIELSRIIPYGQVQVFKTSPEGDQKVKAIGDYCVGWIEGSLVSGNWNGGDEMLKSSYE